jgi:hypothetical protein
MLSLLLALSLAAAPPTPVTGAPDTPVWTPIVSYDEVRIDVDTTRVVGDGPYTLWLRWSFLERPSSPQSWDAGVRGSLDYVEVDCTRGATRTFSSIAYRADGTPVPTASFDEPAAEWRVARPGTIGAEITSQVCGLARANR